jgi:hypothetical protein
VRTARETIPAHLRLLNGNDKAVVAAYVGEAIDEDVASPRDVLALMQANVLVENAAGVRRLSRNLQSHLDDVMRKRRSYRAGENFAGQVEMLESLAAACEDAMMEGHLERQTQLEDDFQHAAESLAQGIQETLAHLRAEVDNEFGDLPSFAEKSRQNVHYTKRVEETIDALALIGDSKIVDRFERQPLLEQQERIHRRELINRLPTWRQEFMAISEVMGRHVHTLRRVDPEAKALRRLELHMRTNTAYEMMDEPDDGVIHIWMEMAEGLAATIHPDINDAATEDVLQTTLEGMPRTPLARSAKRTAGVLVKDVDKPAPIIIRRPPWRVAYDAMVEEAAGRRVSARETHSTAATGTTMDIWLIYVAATVGTTKNATGLRSETRFKPHGPKDGLLMMRDVFLWTQ